MPLQLYPRKYECFAVEATYFYRVCKNRGYVKPSIAVRKHGKLRALEIH
jgi:hypothetical protein